MARTKTLDLASDDFLLDTPLLNGAFSEVLDAPFADCERYDQSIDEARKDLAAAEAELNKAKAAAAKAQDSAERAEVLVDLKEMTPGEVHSRLSEYADAEVRLDAAEHDVRIKRKRLTVLRELKAETKSRAQAAAKADADTIRADKVKAMADAYRVLLRANAELCEVETKMQDRGLLRPEQRNLLWDPEVMPRHHSIYPRDTTKTRGVARDTRASRWFAAARQFGFDV